MYISELQKEKLCFVSKALSTNFDDIDIIKDFIFNEINLLTEDTNEETSLDMISLIAQFDKGSSKTY